MIPPIKTSSGSRVFFPSASVRPSTGNGEKTAEAAQQRHPITFRRRIHVPRRWCEIAGQTGDDDDETFDPHDGVDEKRDDEEGDRVTPDTRRPERLWHEHIEDHQRPKD